MKKFAVILLVGLVAISLAACSSTAPDTDQPSPATGPEAEIAGIVEEFVNERHNFTYETYTGLEGLEEYTEDPIYSALMLNADTFVKRVQEGQEVKEITNLSEIEVTMVDEEKAEFRVELTVDWTKNGNTESTSYELTGTMQKFEAGWLITLLNGPV